LEELFAGGVGVAVELAERAVAAETFVILGGLAGVLTVATHWGAVAGAVFVDGAGRAPKLVVVCRVAAAASLAADKAGVSASAAVHGVSELMA